MCHFIIFVFVFQHLTIRLNDLMEEGEQEGEQEGRETGRSEGGRVGR